MARRNRTRNAGAAMAEQLRVPRIMVAGSASGVGKTTVTVGLIGALRARGLKVAAFKCGPDYLDPTYHARAVAAPSHNLDGWMMGRDVVLGTFARVAGAADIAVIEGMMGLFDGALPAGEEGSSAEIAKWLGAPVMLVVDASGIARTVAAIAHGFARFDPKLKLAALACNRLGSRGHLALLREACPSPPVVGGLPAEPQSAFPERHLGLLAADRKAVPEATLAAWGKLAAEWFELDRVIEIARQAPALRVTTEPAPAGPARARCRIGLAFDEAFHFYYEDNLRRLEVLGAALVRFSPVRDQSLPEVDGLYFGGGYPEAAARELSSNSAMLAAVRAFAGRGGPVYAECGGLMYLARAIRTLEGRSWPMVGLMAGEAVMADRLQALGYVEVETLAPSILGAAGTRFRGHQFRYSTLRGMPAAVTRLYSSRSPSGREQSPDGYQIGNLVASYVHAYWASNPAVARALVRACAQFAAARR